IQEPADRRGRIGPVYAERLLDRVRDQDRLPSRLEYLPRENPRPSVAFIARSIDDHRIAAVVFPIIVAHDPVMQLETRQVGRAETEQEVIILKPRHRLVKIQVHRRHGRAIDDIAVDRAKIVLEQILQSLPAEWPGLPCRNGEIATDIDMLDRNGAKRDRHAAGMQLVDEELVAVRVNNVVIIEKSEVAPGTAPYPHVKQRRPRVARLRGGEIGNLEPNALGKRHHRRQRVVDGADLRRSETLSAYPYRHRAVVLTNERKDAARELGHPPDVVKAHEHVEHPVVCPRSALSAWLRPSARLRHGHHRVSLKLNSCVKSVMPSFSMLAFPASGKGGIGAGFIRLRLNSCLSHFPKSGAFNLWASRSPEVIMRSKTRGSGARSTVE